MGTVQIWNTQVSTPVQLSGTIVGDVEHESVAARFSEDGEEVIALTKLQQVTIFRLGANSPGFESICHTYLKMLSSPVVAFG